MLTLVEVKWGAGGKMFYADFGGSVGLLKLFFLFKHTSFTFPTLLINS